MDDEQKAAVLAEAREHISAAHQLEHLATEHLMRVDPLVAWRAKSAEREAGRRQERTRRAEAEREFIRQQQAAEPMAFSEFQEKILGELVAELRQQMRDEMQSAVGELRAEVAVARSVERSKIIDLPALPLRKRSDAA